MSSGFDCVAHVSVYFFFFFFNVNSFIAVMKIVQFYSAVESRDILK